MQADDLYILTNAKIVVELNLKLNQDMVNIKCWWMHNNMVVKQGKSKAVLITAYQKATRSETTWMLHNCMMTTNHKR